MVMEAREVSHREEASTYTDGETAAPMRPQTYRLQLAQQLLLHIVEAVREQVDHDHVRVGQICSPEIGLENLSLRHPVVGLLEENPDLGGVVRQRGDLQRTGGIVCERQATR